MKNKFIDKVLATIKEKDALHYKKVIKNVEEIQSSYPKEYESLIGLLISYFDNHQINEAQVAKHYLLMINDMRLEGIQFMKTGEYSCKNQKDAYEKVYSNKKLMNYYMNGLLLSQILWLHHFRMLIFFKETLSKPYLKSVKKILDIGPGHGFFSFLALNELKEFDNIEIVDISEQSLTMTKSIIGDGEGKIKYYQKDIFEFDSTNKYDLIILGEVLEHLDKPKLILEKLSSLLSDNGYLWITTPTNAPALDHVYLFKDKQEIIDLLKDANFNIKDSYGCYAENVSETIAKRFKVSYLYGALLNNEINLDYA